MKTISLSIWSNKSGLFGGPAFFQPIIAFWKLFKLLWLANCSVGWIKAGPSKKSLLFDHVNRLYKLVSCTFESANRNTGHVLLRQEKNVTTLQRWNVWSSTDCALLSSTNLNSTSPRRGKGSCGKLISCTAEPASHNTGHVIFASCDNTLEPKWPK